MKFTFSGVFDTDFTLFILTQHDDILEVNPSSIYVSASNTTNPKIETITLYGKSPGHLDVFVNATPPDVIE